MGRIIDMSGITTQNNIYVIKRAKGYTKEAHWVCKCPMCNREDWIVKGSKLRGNNQVAMCKDCSAKNNLKAIKKPFFKDLTNQKFGMLTALKPTNKRNGTSIIWECICDCGNVCYKTSSYLLNGDTKSCGCISKSYGESLIYEILKSNNIPFETEKHFQNCVGRFDFYVNNQYIIEFDGRQHFYKTNTGFGKEYENIHQRDLKKNKYCFENNIPIIRISFDNIEKICYNNIRIENSDFILTEENEDEYYRRV